MFYVEKVSKSFGSRQLLEDITFTISHGERVGLVGPNGIGKSTLLRMIAGEEQPDSGAAGHRGGVLRYLHQQADLVPENTLVEEMWMAFPEVREIDLRLRDVAGQMESGAGDITQLVDEQTRLYTTFESLDGYRVNAHIGRVLDGLGFSVAEREQRCRDFSGGWQMRIALAKILVTRPDHVLLDEPTNHLDASARDWLAQELRSYPGAMVIITHDGAFLDRVATRILEVDELRVTSYSGNFSSYRRQKAARIEQQDHEAARQQREIQRQERFIERFRAKATKARQVKSREKAIARVARVERTRKAPEVRFTLSAHGRPELNVLTLRGVSHAYGDTPVLLDVDLTVERGQKVALVGPNGSGKSTLLQIANGSFKPSEGIVLWADRARPGYYDQHQDEALEPDLNVLDAARAGADGTMQVRARTLLGQFLFRGDDVFKPISVLSGGERSRVALAKFLIQPTNVLLLDEPTNHLDEATRRRLIEALSAYDGTIICASHDPAILEDVATHVYEVKDGGCRELEERRRLVAV